MIRHLHERYLDELLRRDNSVSIHHRNIQSLATEKFKIKNEMSPEIASDIFTKRTDTTAWKAFRYEGFPGPNTGKYGPEKLLIWPLFAECTCYIP